MALPPGVLIVEDETALAANIARFLGRHGYETRVAESAEAALTELETFRPDTIVLDFNLPGMNGLDFLTRVRASDPQIRLIMATGHGSERVAVDAMKAGAYDYLTKPLSLGRLKDIVDRAVREDSSPRPTNALVRPAAFDRAVDRLVGRSAPMLALKALVERLIASESALRDGDPPAVLINGETGTGKELVARALHYDGRRRDAPFVEVNCSSIPAHLLEAELFGYERGAFTDARERKLGLIESAEGGTLFLDEIGEMDLAIQAKLLKFLEDKTVRRLGSVREQRANVRIVAATHRNLEQRVQDGRFRADLMYRLRIVLVEVPPLRSLRGDILDIAQHYLRLHGARYGRAALRFSDGAVEKLLAHGWPGNVRELRNVLEQAVILGLGDVIEAEHLRLAAALPQGAATGHAGAGAMNLVDAERQLLVRALEETGWNVTRAARLLGVSRDTLRYRIEKYGLRLPS